MASDHCNAVHFWYNVPTSSYESQAAVTCEDWVAALEAALIGHRGVGAVRELMEVLVADRGGELPAMKPEPVVETVDAEEMNGNLTRITLLDGKQVSAVALCSRCRENPPRPEGPWCWDCHQKFLREIGEK